MLPALTHCDPGDENTVPEGPQVCTVCRQWNAGTHDAFGARVCGRASCLRVAQDRELATKQGELTEAYQAYLEGSRAARYAADEKPWDDDLERRAAQLEEDTDRAMYELTRAHRAAFWVKEEAC